MGVGGEEGCGERGFPTVLFPCEVGREGWRSLHGGVTSEDVLDRQIATVDKNGAIFY